ncbi:MAG: hypothetical protein IV100_13830 [Myxococcales bacterium]|nr:hypothetical protein [Myxococcales bacterium]
MCSRLAAAVSLFVLLGGAVACDETAVAPASDTAQPPADGSECVPSACARSGTAAKPSFQVGTNEAGVIDVGAFEEAKDTSEVPVILGGQGAWMVVLAVATNQLDCCVDRINIRAQLATVDGSEVLGMINYRRRPLVSGDDGMRYLMNTWMVLGDETKWKDKSAVLTLSVEPYGGGPILEKTVTVTLRKDTSSAANESPLRLGTHTRGTSDPSAFVTLNDGDELMVGEDDAGEPGLVLATSTRTLEDAVDEVAVNATLTFLDNPGPQPSLDVSERALVKGPDDADYLMDLWMGLGDEAEWKDQRAQLTVGIDAIGSEVTLSQSVTITLRKQAAQ